MIPSTAYAREIDVHEPHEPTADDIRRANVQLDMTQGLDIIAQTVWGEARGETMLEQAAVVWVILNRADARNQTIEEVCTQRHQFAWRKNAPVTPKIMYVVKDVVFRWLLEKYGCFNVGRVIPKDYQFFASWGDGENHFRKNYDSTTYWDWSLECPEYFYQEVG